jgi:VIT1/CCC1 family predicted Fe2+/Mn2+ transporter
MLESLSKPSAHALEPMDRISEVLFALIMVLTFTCSFSVAGAGREDVRAMLFGALGCNLAWGFIDAAFYLMGGFSAMGHGLMRLKALRQVTDPAKAHQIIAHAMPPVLASILTSADFEAMRRKLNQLPELPLRPRLGREEWYGAFAVFLTVVLTTVPVITPFALIQEVKRALRVSNSIAITMLFLAGYAFGRYSGYRPARMGLMMVLLGSAMVGITISLGG